MHNGNLKKERIYRLYLANIYVFDGVDKKRMKYANKFSRRKKGQCLGP